MTSWREVLAPLVAGDNLDRQLATWAMDEILTGNATPAQIAGFAVALRAKGETVAELAALADAMIAKATPIAFAGKTVDVVGTGGDRANTVNVSTMAAIVAAAAGVRVVKHGNRAASSACGTADCLEELGVALNVPPEQQSAILDECGIVFLFAPLYHQSLRFAGGPRRELAIPTTFNFLGPLANPARPIGQAVGCADERMAPLMAGVLASRGGQGLVFHGADGLDELTTTGPSRVWLIGNGQVQTGDFDPRNLGIAPAELQSLVGGSPTVNSRIVIETLAGQPGPVRDIVALNAAAARLAEAGPQLGVDLAEQLRPHWDAALAAIDSGAAAQLLDRWVQATQKAAA